MAVRNGTRLLIRRKFMTFLMDRKILPALTTMTWFATLLPPRTRRQTRLAGVTLALLTPMSLLRLAAKELLLPQFQLGL